MNLFSNKEDFKEFSLLVDNLTKKTEAKQTEKDLPPTYLKFYPIFQYDRLKFRKLFNEWLETDEGKNRTYESLEKKQKEILDVCYKKDRYGKKRDCDEKHIFRYQTLHKIYREIYNRLGAPLNVNEFKGFIVFRDEYTKDNYIYKGQTYKGQEFMFCGATVKGTEDLPVFKKIKIHIKVLRLLKKGVCIERVSYG